MNELPAKEAVAESGFAGPALGGGPVLGTGPVLGFIGLGAIGRPMARRLVASGAKVVVYNRTREKTRGFEADSIIAESPAEVADRAEIVFSCLTTPQSYHEVVLGPNGVIRGRRAKIYVHTGTNEVGLLSELETSLGRHGITTIDAPITGGVDGAARGALTVMAAGPIEAFERAAAAMRAYASKIVFLGERVGAAQYMKLVNNILSAANLAIASEAMVVGSKAGLDLSAMLDVLNHGSGQNSATLTKIPKAVLPRTFNHGASLAVLLKDLRAFLHEAGSLGVPTPIGDAVVRAYEGAVETEGADADITHIVRAIERRAGWDMPQVVP